MAYSENPEYRKMVTELAQKTDFPLITTQKPVVSVLRYHHLGIAVSSFEVSIAYYHKLGFSLIDSNSADSKVVRLLHPNGLELHLLQAQQSGEDNKKYNVLMDDPLHKPPGHTHASWTVPSVAAAREFIESRGLVVSGTRNTLALFTRDPDRTTLELERNDGHSEPSLNATNFDASMIGASRPLDHVGIRVRAPYDRHMIWYAEKLGFVLRVATYPPDDDPLKNNPPWITRTNNSSTNCDINFIINSNTIPPTDSNGCPQEQDNVLLKPSLRTGIIYAGFAIEQSPLDALRALREAGVDAISDDELKEEASSSWNHLPSTAVFRFVEGPSILVRDLNGIILRLVKI